jgi:hypothetical protein
MRKTMSDLNTARSGSILRVELNRPTKKNAMAAAIYTNLAEIFNDAGKDEAVRPRLQDGVFSPEDITALTAFEDTLRTLGFRDRKHPTVLLVAKRVIELARQGERNPKLLQNAVLKSLRDDSGVSGM